MKDMAITILICFTLVLCVVLLKTDFYPESSWNPNSGLYKYVPKAPEAWTKQFGDTEESRLTWAITALRAEQLQQGKKLSLIKDICLNDPNEVAP